MELLDSNSPRRLPKLKIEDTEFFVDVRLEEFRQVDNPQNRISFDDLHQIDDHYRFFFDMNTKNAYRGTYLEMSERKDVKFVRIPSLFELDPEGMNKLIGEWAQEAREKRRSTKSNDQSIDQDQQKQTKGKGRGI